LLYWALPEVSDHFTVWHMSTSNKCYAGCHNRWPALNFIPVHISITAHMLIPLPLIHVRRHTQDLPDCALPAACFLHCSHPAERVTLFLWNIYERLPYYMALHLIRQCSSYVIIVEVWKLISFNAIGAVCGSPKGRQPDNLFINLCVNHLRLFLLITPAYSGITFFKCF
jgi:hypothetical protein